MPNLANAYVISYSSAFKNLWNTFISQSDRATFLFDRGFMDYHADRFTDRSVMLFLNNELVAVFPANESQGIIHSHQGLTYGGLVTHPNVSAQTFATYFAQICDDYAQKGFKTLIYKEIPSFYTAHCQPPISLSQFPMAQLCQTDVGAVIDLQQKLHFWHGREQSIAKSKQHGLYLKSSSNQYIDNQLFDKFWEQLLVPQLKTKYRLKPTHTVSEIKLLAKAFPDHIKQYNIYAGEQLIAGTTIFENKQVAHSQYIASNELGKKLCGLDFLFHFLLTEKYKDFHFFSFGISNWHGTSKINEGLLNWKKSWGATVCPHHHFRVQLDSRR